MADLIDRQALLRDIEKYHLSDGMFQHWVEVQPSVEAEPVRRGHWAMTWHNLFRAKLPVCSCCGRYAVFKSKYCQNCGARMDGEQDG